MTLFFADLVREYSYSAGAGDLVLAGAVAGHRRFADAVPAGARFHYAIAGVTHPEEWETGEGEIGSGGALVRLPLVSSAGVAPETGEARLVEFTAGLKLVTLTVAASWFAGQEAGPGIEDVAGLPAALAGKAAAGHHHDGSYAAAGHAHEGVYAHASHHHDAAYQPRDAELTALAALNGAADRIPYFTGPGAAAMTELTPFGRSLVGGADAAAARATLGLGNAAAKAIGTSGDAVPVLGGGVTAWAAGASFQGAIRTTGRHIPTSGVGLESFYEAAAGMATILAFDRSAAVYKPLTVAGRTIALHANGADVATITAGGIDVAGELRGDALRIDATPAASAAATTHKLAVNLNGTIFYLLLSSS